MESLKDKQMGGGITEEQQKLVKKIEESIKRLVLIGHSVSIIKLKEELESFSSDLVDRAIYNLAKTEEFKEIKEGKFILRKK